MRRIFFLALLFVLAPTSLLATTYYVGPGQTYSTIQSAINVASNGDDIYVYSGTYTENLDFQSKAINLTSANGASATILDGNGLGPVVTIVNAPLTSTDAFAVITGFTIRNGGKPQATAGPQGGVYINNSYVLMQKDIITNTVCNGINAINSLISLTNSTVQNTTVSSCTSGEGTGSGIRISGNAPAAVGSIIHINSEGFETDIIQNNNASTAASDNGGGGGINITNVTVPVYVSHTIIRNNTSKGYGGGFYLGNTAELHFEDNLVYGNNGISGGLDIVIPGASTGPLVGDIVNNTIAENSGIGTTANIASDLYIGGNLGQYLIANNVIVGYTNGQSAVNCGTQYANQTITPLRFDHNDIYSVAGSTNTPVGGACTNPAGTHGNISVDPQFVLATPAALAAGTSDFHPVTASPVVDTGTNAVANSGAFISNLYDLSGNTRPQTPGSGYRFMDMGAYELTGNNTTNYGSEITYFPSTYTVTAGNTVTLNAYVATNTNPPTGSVTYYEDGVALGTTGMDSSGRSALVTAPLTAGVHLFEATYPGAGTQSPATAIPFYLKVGNAVAVSTTTALTSSANPSNFGQSVTFTAHMTATDGSTPTGSVTFYDGANSLGAAVTVDGSGNATLSTSALIVGSHSITAAFLATGNYNGSSGSLTQIVNGAATTSTLTAAPTTAAYGTTITLTAKVTSATAGTPSGTITFTIDGVAAAPVNLTAATATYSATGLNGGSHSLGCTYSGDTTYAVSTCNAATATITPAATSMSLSASANPSTALTPVTFTAKLTSGATAISGAPVTFAIDGATAATINTNASGIATFIASLPVTTHSITANYAASTNYSASTANLTEILTPNATTAAIVAAPNPVYQNQSLTIGVSIHASTGNATPDGTVTIFDNGTQITSITTPPFSYGSTTTNVSFSTSTLTPGTHVLTANYAPLPNFTASGTSGGGVTVTVLPQTFDFKSSSPSLTIQTEHHGSLALALDSIGGFAAPIYLSCKDPLPPVVTCELPGSVNLPANGTANATLTLDTDALLNFAQNKPPQTSRTSLIAFATLAPLALLALARRRRLALGLFATLILTLNLTACSGKYPDHTPPGTYNVTLIATGTTAGASAPTTQTLTIQLIVTP